MTQIHHRFMPIIIKSAGEMASGIAVRLYRAGFRHVLMLEVSAPVSVRRTVSFSEAVWEGTQEVEGILSRLASSLEEVKAIWIAGEVAVAVDPKWLFLSLLAPEITIDAVIAKRNLGTFSGEAPLVIALGPGFTAGKDAHYIIETQRGHNLGRIYTKGMAEPNTGIPGSIGGHSIKRVLRAPSDGVVEPRLNMGDLVQVGEVVCTVDGAPVQAAIDGIVRGCIRPGISVKAGCKIGDIDPRAEKAYCYTVSEKARALGGAVLEVICAHYNNVR